MAELDIKRFLCDFRQYKSDEEFNEKVRKSKVSIVTLNATLRFIAKAMSYALEKQSLRFKGGDLVEIEPQSNAVDILLDGINPDKMVDEFILPDNFTKRLWSGEFRTALLEIYRQGLEDMLQAIRDLNKKV